MYFSELFTYLFGSRQSARLLGDAKHFPRTFAVCSGDDGRVPGPRRRQIMAPSSDRNLAAQHVKKTSILEELMCTSQGSLSPGTSEVHLQSSKPLKRCHLHTSGQHPGHSWPRCFARGSQHQSNWTWQLGDDFRGQ